MGRAWEVNKNNLVPVAMTPSRGAVFPFAQTALGLPLLRRGVQGTRGENPVEGEGQQRLCSAQTQATGLR